MGTFDRDIESAGSSLHKICPDNPDAPFGKRHLGDDPGGRADAKGSGMRKYERRKVKFKPFARANLACSINYSRRRNECVLFAI